ncbi:hypothetical protein EVAR_38352_1 [Eumeta japonica]|uniref:Uncharacterized protein n=1 Tax=Eumeta variegata TaxID=151549 RepID=A0A4C1XYV8_EUMVA|nr:hypothetical protein EVAR_38352_1 [Eumeta japonica]
MVTAVINGSRPARGNLDPRAQYLYCGEGGGGARRCARDGPAAPPHPPAHAPLPTVHPAHPAHPANTVKTERLSPHDNTSTASRSRSVTPSTSSYPGTPPERGSPGAGAGAGGAPLSAPAPAQPLPPRNYSDIMRSLAARYNPHHNNDNKSLTAAGRRRCCGGRGLAAGRVSGTVTEINIFRLINSSPY